MVSDGLRTTVLPAATFQMAIKNGWFQGATWPTTPTGSRRTYDVSPGQVLRGRGAFQRPGRTREEAQVVDADRDLLRTQPHHHRGMDPTNLDYVEPRADQSLRTRRGGSEVPCVVVVGWLGTATVTTQGLTGSHDTTKRGDLVLATSGDSSWPRTHMCTTGTLCDDPGSRLFTRLNPDRAKNRAIHRLEAMGYRVSPDHAS